MTDTPPRFIPARQLHGGTPAGTSYLNGFIGCRRRHFNLFVRPFSWDDGREGEGIAPRSTAPDLLKGSTFHEGLAAWYLSGCRDGADTGEYDVERAVAVAENHHAARLHEWEDTSEAADAIRQIVEMLRSYHDWYGPGGRRPDYPTIQVMHNGEGEPLIEREFALDLDYGGYLFTCRVDAIVEHHGYLKIMEHKTSAASWVGRRLKTTAMDAQFTGEIAVLEALFPNELLFGCLVNVVAKNRGANSKLDVATRDTTTRTSAQLRRFPAGCVEILKRIDQSHHQFTELVEQGVDIERAADVAYPLDGTRNGTCYAYNRSCPYMGLCQNPGDEDQILRSFRPRTEVERKRDKEWNE
jgi:hypothetical protein